MKSEDPGISGDFGSQVGVASDTSGAFPIESEAPRLSICMATFNGESYVRAQIESILKQLAPNDELVVVDDASTDRTVAIVSSFSDARIRVLRSPKNLGHVRAFERAIGESRGLNILLSDQDDVWIPGRVERMLDLLDNASIVATNWRLMGGDEHTGPHFSDSESTNSMNLRNLIGILRGRLPYFGCAMGMRQDAMSIVLPFPRGTEAHDIWIALAGNVAGTLVHSEAATVERRIHADNLTPRRRRGWRKILRTRLLMVRLIYTAIRRRKRVSVGGRVNAHV